jgi:hypothetical protein
MILEWDGVCVENQLLFSLEYCLLFKIMNLYGWLGNLH